MPERHPVVVFFFFVLEKKKFQKKELIFHDEYALIYKFEMFLFNDSCEKKFETCYTETSYPGYW